MKTTAEKTLLVIAFLGILLSTYAITLHYAPSASSICTYGTALNCDKVNKSAWASFAGIPVAVMGIIAYLTVFLIVLKRKRIQRLLSFTERDYWMYVYIFTMFMFSFQLYLTFVEAYIIGAYCLLCLGSQLCTIALGFITGREALRTQ